MNSPSFSHSFVCSLSQPLWTVSRTAPRQDDNAEDFVTLLTCIADLYSQALLNVLNMEEIDGDSIKVLARYASGVTSNVSSIVATFTQKSDLKARAKRNERRPVVIKEYPPLFTADGRPRPDADSAHLVESFITEMRVLTHPPLRQHENIVTVLGVQWDTRCEGVFAQPVLVLEHASERRGDLAAFLDENKDLPFSMKKHLALDVARGLEALHAHGVIHGDLKPQNVLIFHDPGKTGEEAYRAKITDFGLSVLDAGDNKPTRLRGRTPGFHAPEWQREAVPERLKKTDVYSYGLVAACIFFGRGITQQLGHADEDDEHDEDGEDKERAIAYFLAQLEHLSDPLIDDPRAIVAVLRATLSRDPDKRSLSQAMAALLLGRQQTTKDGKPQPANAQSVAARVATLAAIGVPYQALEKVSERVRTQIVVALRAIHDNEHDSRRADASFELCICASAAFGAETPDRTQFGQDEAMHEMSQYVLDAARGGNSWARVTVLPVLRAAGRAAVAYDEAEVVSWLEAEAKTGSLLALDQLRQTSAAIRYEKLEQQTSAAIRHEKLEQLYHQTFCGTPEALYGDDRKWHSAVHHAAAVGSVAQLRAALAPSPSSAPDQLINSQNSAGDTPLICAARAGHLQAVQLLVDARADGRIVNANGESALHFLVQFSDADIAPAALLLGRAGASENLQRMASASSCNTHHNLTRLTGPGTPAYRAVLAGNVTALKALFRLEDDCLAASGVTAAAAPALTTTLPSMLGRLLATATKLLHLHQMELLIQRFQRGHAPDVVVANIARLHLWDDSELCDLWALALRGLASARPDAGMGWPERFTRIVRFGPHYRGVLDSCLQLLYHHCLPPPSLSRSERQQKLQSCAELAVARKHRDAMPFFVEALHRAAFTPPLRAMPSFQPPRHHSHIMAAAALLYMAFSQTRSILFWDLLQMNNGMILGPAPGPSDGQRVHDHGDKNLVKTAELRPEYDPSDDEYNYVLVYLTWVSMSSQPNILLGRIVLESYRHFFPSRPLRWTPNCRFESETSFRAMMAQPANLPPLVHAVRGNHSEFAALLLAAGASPQDPVYTLTKDKKSSVSSPGSSLLRYILADGLLQPEHVQAHLPETSRNFEEKLLLDENDRKRRFDRLSLLLEWSAASHTACILTQRDMLAILALEDFPRSPGKPGPLLWTINAPRILLKNRSLAVCMRWLASVQHDRLWDAIAAANAAQKKPIRAHNRRSHLVTLAAMQRNTAALRILLGGHAGGDGDGNGCLSFSVHGGQYVSWRWPQTAAAFTKQPLKLTPVDFLRWAQNIPDEWCYGDDDSFAWKKRVQDAADTMQGYGATASNEISPQQALPMANMAKLLLLRAARRASECVIVLVITCLTLEVIFEPVMLLSSVDPMTKKIVRIFFLLMAVLILIPNAFFLDYTDFPADTIPPCLDGHVDDKNILIPLPAPFLDPQRPRRTFLNGVLGISQRWFVYRQSYWKIRVLRRIVWWEEKPVSMAAQRSQLAVVYAEYIHSMELLALQEEEPEAEADLQETVASASQVCDRINPLDTGFYSEDDDDADDGPGRAMRTSWTRRWGVSAAERGRRFGLFFAAFLKRRAIGAGGNSQTERQRRIHLRQLRQEADEQRPLYGDDMS